MATVYIVADPSYYTLRRVWTEEPRMFKIALVGCMFMFVLMVFASETREQAQ